MKWNSDQIITFLNIYEKYTVLWDIRSKDHINQLKRGTAFENLLQELKDNEGFEGMDLVVLKTKIKTIKTVYRQELNKVKKSKKSGTGADDIYKPKLIWFAKADSFLRNVSETRKTTNNMDELDIQESSNDVEDQDNSDIDQSETLKVKPKIETSSKNDKDVVFQTPKRKRCVSKTPDSGIHSAITALKDIVEKNEGNTDDEYDIFGKHIAVQLRQLPIQNFIILQGEIQQLITRERLNYCASINQNFNMQKQQDQPNNITLYNLQSRPSTSSSNYSPTSDILQQAFSDIDYI